MVSLRKAVQQYNRGEYFACHETLEDLWLDEPGPKRTFLQGLLHVAVCLYHFECGNMRGALSQAGKALAKIEAFRDDPFDIGIDRLESWLIKFRSQLEFAAQSPPPAIQWQNPPAMNLPGPNPWE